MESFVSPIIKPKLVWVPWEFFYKVGMKKGNRFVFIFENYFFMVKNKKNRKKMFGSYFFFKCFIFRKTRRTKKTRKISLISNYFLF